MLGHAFLSLVLLTLPHFILIGLNYKILFSKDKTWYTSHIEIIVGLFAVVICELIYEFFLTYDQYQYSLKDTHQIVYLFLRNFIVTLIFLPSMLTILFMLEVRKEGQRNSEYNEFLRIGLNPEDKIQDNFNSVPETEADDEL